MILLSAIRRHILRLSALAVLSAAPCFAAGISATATYTATPDPNTSGLYDYSLTLNNTGTTTIGTFWFAWIPGGDFLSPPPVGITAPAGWTFGTFTNSAGDGTSIRWVTTTNLLAAGSSLSGFNFMSTETPDQLLKNYNGASNGLGLPVLTSFVYIAAPLRDPGAQFVATAATPEPGSLLLTLTGLGMAAGSIRMRLSRRDGASSQIAV